MTEPADREEVVETEDRATPLTPPMLSTIQSRIVAIILVALVAPALLFLGKCAIEDVDEIGIVLGLPLVLLTWVTFAGARGLWFRNRKRGAVVALVILAAISGLSYVLLFRWGSF